MTMLATLETALELGRTPHDSLSLMLEEKLMLPHHADKRLTVQIQNTSGNRAFEPDTLHDD
jgi:hypothetical protein